MYVSEPVYINNASTCTLSCIPAVACRKLTAPQNGSLSTNDHYPGVAVNVSCDPGFTISGDFSLVCLDSGRWNHGLPSCIPGKSVSFPDPCVHKPITIMHCWVLLTI